MPGRSFSTPSYRYGYNRKEKDDEVKGSGNQQDYGMRIYDPRLGKFLSVDPLTKSYPWNSTYAFAENSPILCIDLDGEEKLPYFEKESYKHSRNKNVTFADNTVKTFANTFIGFWNTGYDLLVEKKSVDNLLWEAQANTDRALCNMDPNSPGFYEDLIAGLATSYVGGKLLPQQVSKPVKAAATSTSLDINLTLSTIKTPYGSAIQSTSTEALAVRARVASGSTLYRVGTIGKSQTMEAQFWSPYNPADFTPKEWAAKNGIPASNLEGGTLFIESGTLNKGSNFITRNAPGIGTNAGGAIEVVTNPGSVTGSTFSTGSTSTLFKKQ